MNIIIVGCGKVGQALAEQLNEEGNNITVIDLNPKKVNSVSARLDIMGVVGNGATHMTQQEAGIKHADLLIAVTASDELNLLFGLCSGAGFAAAAYMLSGVYGQLYSKDVPSVFRGYPAVMIFTGIIAMALYGILGHIPSYM